MSVDPLSILIGGSVGVAVGVTIASYYRRSGKKTEVEKTVDDYELNRSKREIGALMLEKELLSSSLMRLYEAESEGRINREDRETLSKKYRDQLKDVDGRINSLQLVVEVGELEKLRKELTNLFEKKLGEVEKRLEEARKRRKVEKVAEVKEVVKKEKEEEKPKKKVERKPKSEAEEKVMELRKEVMDALKELERIDVE